MGARSEVPEAASQADAGQRSKERLRRTRRLLREARGHLRGRALKLLGFVAFAYLFLKLIPGLEKALKDLQNVEPQWVVAAMAIETVSTIGYVIAWRGILDPDNLLRQEGRKKHLGAGVAWAQLGGGMLVPGGTLGSIGVGAWMLHRLGIAMDRVGERQFTLMFLNSGVDGLAIVFFGTGLAIGVFNGESNLALTLLPAAVVVVGLVLVLIVARRAQQLAERLEGGRPKLSAGVRTIALAVQNTKNMLRHRGSAKIVLGSIVYLAFDMAVLQFAFVAIDAHPVPSFADVSMCYLIGGLAGSIPLPANLGAVTGMAGMLIVFGVGNNNAIAAVVLYQAIGLLVPLLGGAIAYLFLRREFGSMDADAPEVAQGAPG